MDDKCCGTCQFWTTEWQDDKGSDVCQCIRFPPQIVIPITNDSEPHNIAMATKFPTLSYVRLCGEWAAN